MMEKYFEGWTFRTNRPDFTAGEEVTVFVTGFDGDGGVARVGDTVLQVPDAPRKARDKLVRLRVEEFDANDHEGRATFLEIVGEETF